MMQRKYLARAKDWALSETKNGTEQIAVYFEISTPEADIPAITWFGFFTDKTWERTIESMRICGWTGSDLTKIEGLDANEVELVIEDEEHEGRVRPKVRWVNKPGGIAIKAPLSGDKAKAFAAVMAQKIKALDASAPKPAGKPAPKKPAPHIGTAGGPPPLTDDDLQF